MTAPDGTPVDILRSDAGKYINTGEKSIYFRVWEGEIDTYVLHSHYFRHNFHSLFWPAKLYATIVSRYQQTFFFEAIVAPSMWLIICLFSYIKFSKVSHQYQLNNMDLNLKMESESCDLCKKPTSNRCAGCLDGRLHEVFNFLNGFLEQLQGLVNREISSMYCFESGCVTARGSEEVLLPGWKLQSPVVSLFITC